MFQSLSGFQVRCNSANSRIIFHTSILFQSLSGFQVRCNSSTDCPHIDSPVGFNPYRVFKFVATQNLPQGPARQDLVSIPIGFSSSLQRSPGNRWCGCACPGFNPYRVFKFVATSRMGTFQTLLSKVSIPIGFSSSLQPD